MKVIELTNTNSESVWLVASWIIKIKFPASQNKGKCVIDHSGGMQEVMETPEQVVKMLEDA